MEEEEEKIDTTHNKTNKEKRDENQERIFDARSESRKEFTKIKLNDPKQKLQEIPLKKAKERRQENFKENRLKKTEVNKNQINYLNYNDSNKLCDMIKQLTQTLHQYMDTTNKEIENIKKIVNLNYKLTIEGKEKSENFKDETNDRIQNIIITQKELIQRWEAIGSQFESSIDNITNFTNKPNKKNRIINEAGIKIHSKNGKWQPPNKAIQS